MTTTQLISEDDFYNVYRPVPVPGTNPDNAEYYHQYDQVKDLDIHHVWTLVDGENDGIYALPGFHVVNKFAYVVTEKAWVSGMEEAVYLEAEEREDEEGDVDEE